MWRFKNKDAGFGWCSSLAKTTRSGVRIRVGMWWKNKINFEFISIMISPLRSDHELTSFLNHQNWVLM
ncbi:hypothetical protein C5167_041556 [Papaver somniferum]|nr:hypothetical protein C5167_041556 [Papaver somniferum]